MRLHVLTAVSRPENLGRVADSLQRATAKVPWVDVSWHWRFDMERRHTGGQALKNLMLDDIGDGWVWILDDDTEAHQDVFCFWPSELHYGPFDAVVFSQLRTDGRVLHADPENVRLGYIDAGQAFLRRDIIGDARIPEDYNGDFPWLAQVLDGSRVAWVPNILSLHNAISGVDVSV